LIKKKLMITLWSVGILYGLLWFFGILYGTIHLHRFSLKPVFFLATHAYIAYTSFRYLREALGGPPVDFKSEEGLSPEHSQNLRSLWK
jgi:hypothetical protein